MQRVNVGQTRGTSTSKDWFSSRRNHHIRTLYSLFYAVHTALSITPLELKTLNDLLNHEAHGPLLQIKELSQTIFANNRDDEPYGQHLNWAVQTLFHTAEKIRANLDIIAFHNQSPRDPAQTKFSSSLDKDQEHLHKQLALLLDNATSLLQLMLEEQSGNDLLLRLLVEQEEVSQALWSTSTHALFSEMFAGQPEAGYVQAAKSYFMGQWLEAALQCYETSLKLNDDLSEPRRQTYQIRAMIKDRDTV